MTSVHALKKALGHFNKHTSACLYGWAPPDLLELSDEALGQFCSILNKVEELVALPAQDLVTLICMLGKALDPSGDRPVALCGLVYRVLMAVRKGIVIEWNRHHAGFWDTALEGSDALRGAVARNLLCEAATLTSKVAVQNLWDMSKFYDSIDWSRLAEVALDLNYSPRLLALGLQAHCGGRILQANGAVTTPIGNFDTSILAGCMQSTIFARIFLYHILDDIHKQWPMAGPKQHVDDLSQTVYGNDEFVEKQLTESGIQLACNLHAAGLVISPKTVIIPKSSKAAQNVARALESKGFSVRLAADARDLGIDSTAGRKRCVKLQNSRLKKARLRGKRIRILAKTNAKAKRLTHTGMIPQATWGHEGMGMSPTQKYAS